MYVAGLLYFECFSPMTHIYQLNNTCLPQRTEYFQNHSCIPLHHKKTSTVFVCSIPVIGII